jgi:hypothetical protein
VSEGPRPPSAPSSDDAEAAGTPERPLPRGCNPLVFGLVMATLQMAVLLWLLYGR